MTFECFGKNLLVKSQNKFFRLVKHFKKSKINHLENLIRMRCGPEKNHDNLQTPSFSLEQSQTKSPGTSESTLTPLVLMQLVTHPSPSLTTDPEGKDKILPGLYAAGEVDCSSVHGANRL